MNRKEVLSLMSVLKAAYPSFYRGMSVSDAEAAVNLWCDMFIEDPPQLVAAAVKALIATDTRGYPPNIGSVKERMRKLANPDELTEMEAWGIVQKALRNSSYGAKEEFDTLPPDIQRTVGSPNQLKEWALMDAETVSSVVASNFQRSYKARAAQSREFASLPPDIRKMISGVADRMAIGSGEKGDGENKV